MEIRILMIGDVVGAAGCAAAERLLPSLKRETKADLVVVNAENAAEGNGLTPEAADCLFTAGADVLTGGNHSFRQRTGLALLEESPFVLRPANYPAAAPGRGLCVVDRGAWRAAVISLAGVVYMEPLACPFEAVDRLIAQARQEGAGLIVCDFHAEATSEKRAMGFYTDGRLTALCGTHTHVPTADAGLLPGGTAYVTDLGMVGVEHSVLGAAPASSITRLKGKIPVRFVPAEGPCRLDGVLITADRATGRALAVERVTRRTER